MGDQTTRYYLRNYGPGNLYDKLYTHIDGDLVRYEDHAATLAQAEAEIARLRHALFTVRDSVRCVLSRRVAVYMGDVLREAVEVMDKTLADPDPA